VKGDTLKSEHVIERPVEYTFALRKNKFICTEYLFVSDHCHESHYRVSHPNNAGEYIHHRLPIAYLTSTGAERAGFIEVDLTFLRTERLIKPEPPAVPGRPSYWKISAMLLITVSGRNLRYEVRLRDGNGDVQGVGQTCIAAAFRPGTE